MEQHLVWELGTSVSIVIVLVATIYKSINGKIDTNKIEAKEKMETLQVEVANVIINYKDRFANVDKRFDKVDEQFDQVYIALDKAVAKQDSIIESLHSIDTKLDRQVTTCHLISNQHNLFGKEE